MQRLKTAAARTAQNMESSLEVPTATSVRAIPAKLLIDNRIVVNNHLARARGGKVSFTHLVGFALVEALAEMPEMNHAYTEVDGKPGRRTAGAHQPRHRDRPGEGRRHPPAARPEHQALRVDGLRPVLGGLRGRRPPRANQQARRRRLRRHDDQPDQPGHDRHRALGAAAHEGPGHDHRRRGDGVPGRVPGRLRGDARAAGRQQDHDADVDLRPPHHPGRAVRRLPAHRAPQAARRGRVLRPRLPRAAAAVRADPLGPRHLGRPRRRDQQDRARAGAHPRLPGPRPPHGRHRPAGVQAAPAPGPRRHHPRPDAVGPRPGVPDRRLRRQARHEAAAHPRRPARLLLPHHRHRVHAHPGPRAADVDPGPGGALVRQARPRGAAAHPAPAERRRGLRDLPADEVRRAEAVQPRGRGVGHPAARRRPLGLRPRRPRRGLHRHAAPRPAQRAGEHRRQELRPDLPRVRGHPGPEVGAGLRRRQVPPGHRGRVPRGDRRDDEGLPRRQPVPPRGRQPGARGRRPRQAGPAEPRQRLLLGAAGAAARRRRLRRPGRRRRDAQPVAAARLPHRRHGARGHQQPGRASPRRRRRRGRRSTPPTSPG